MVNRKLKLLIISSRNPYHSANLGFDSMTALRNAGHEVDFITSESFDNQATGMFDLSELSRFEKKIIKLRNKILRHIGKKRGMNQPFFVVSENYYFPCIDERMPQVSPWLITRRIKKKYDMILTLFWQDMLTVKSLEYIYKKTKTPILIQPVDMFPMTGGCYYPADCRQYNTGCENCPALESPMYKKLIRSNWKYKKKVYDNIRCAVSSNSYMLAYAKTNRLFEKTLLRFKSMVLNESVFIEQKIERVKERMLIPTNKKFIMMARCVPSDSLHSRKGMAFMISAINKFCQDKSKDQIAQMLLILVGRGASDIANEIPVQVMDLGIVKQDTLIDAYSVSSLFLSTTIDDAGPTMVNQSIMCSTPVVCFNIGTAVDVIKHKENGYKANVKDVNGLAEGIGFIYGMNEKDYENMRKKTRKIAMSYNSMGAYATAIEQIYNQINS